MNTEPATADQLSATSAEYYRTSTLDTGLWSYKLVVKKDYCGRKVYQKYFEGEPYGQPRSLLSYSEYKRAVGKWLPYKGLSMCVSRWTTTTYA